MNTTTRFSDRADDYVKYRPGYPVKIIALLTEKAGLNKTSVIADIGAGTGISSKLFLDNGNPVYAVEPNKEMREAATFLLPKKENYISINGTAENTHLEKQSIHMIFSAQAFHWFNKVKAKTEFARILALNGNIVLVWNIRNNTHDFQRGYEKILNGIPAYHDVHHRDITDTEIADFFSPKKMYAEHLNNSQTFGLEGLKGRLRSSSYCPKEGAVYDSLMQQLETLFVKHARKGFITFEYITKIFWC